MTARGRASERRLAAFAERFRAAYGAPGLAFGVILPGGDSFASGLGLRRLGSVALDGAVGEDTIFHAASLSKIATAYAVARLADRRIVDLDGTLASALPGSALAGSSFGAATLRQVLSHRAGFPDVEDYGWDEPELDDGALGRYAESCAARAPLFEPGTAFSYSNMGYEAAGYAAARARGTVFEAVARSEALEPLGMASSTFDRREVDPARVAYPHALRRGVVPLDAFPYNRAHAPSSTLQASASDLLSLARAFLSPERDIAASMLRPLAPTGKDRALVKEVGLAWFLGRHRGRTIASHSGSDRGFSSFIALLPGTGAAACALTNLSPVPLDRLCLGLLDLALGEEPAEPRRPDVLRALEAGLPPGGGATDPEDAAYLVAAADSIIESGDPGLAIEILSSALEARPDDARALEAMAKAHYVAGDLAAASACAARSLALDPGNRLLRARADALLGRDRLGSERAAP